MRRNPTKRIEQYRVTSGPMGSEESFGANGAFFIPHPNGVRLKVVVSDGSDWAESGMPGGPWEHVSASLPARCPTWDEMDFLKRLFWKDDETVMQIHVPRASHVNNVATCLHLWRPVGIEIPLPPVAAVGVLGS